MARGHPGKLFDELAAKRKPLYRAFTLHWVGEGGERQHGLNGRCPSEVDSDMGGGGGKQELGKERTEDFSMGKAV